MTGTALASAGTLAANGHTFVCTVAAGAGGSTPKGFSRGVYGSLSPDLSIKSAQITVVLASSLLDFNILLNAVVPQSHFNHIVVLDQNGTWRRFTSASASFIAGGSTTEWQWGNGNTRVWTVASEGTAKPFIVFY